MKNSKILKAICYILIPVILLILSISIFYQVSKDITAAEEPSEYFNSDTFLSNYMLELASEADDLIYNNGNYSFIKDGQSGYRICYKDANTYYSNLDDYYFLILYHDIALTNVELTTNTNTIEGIKKFIQDKEGKKANIINGKVEADSELIETKALQFFENFKNSYYTLIENEGTQTLTMDEEVETTVDVLESKKYYIATINDFQIYSTYSENVKEKENILATKELVNLIKPYENITITAIPVCSVLLLIISVYLIISIGHTKNNKDIDINDFDKIPIELVFIVLATILGVCAALSNETYRVYFEDLSNRLNLVISAIITSYLVTYITSMLFVVTFIKRIKAKILLDTSLCGKVLKFIIKIIIKIFKKIIEKLKKFWHGLTRNWNISSKIVIATMLFIILSAFMIIAFNIVGILFDAFLIIIILYITVIEIENYKKIEKHLKDMYDGKEVKPLVDSEFSKEFKEIVKYINNISNGFENAKQEGIRSERMKTELITNVSHDIKTPLTSIINYVDLLKKEDIKNKKAKEYIEVLDGKSQRLKKLTEDLVEASKASSGNVNLNIERINIVELIKQTTGEFEDKFKEKKLEIISSLPKEDVYINADSRYMYRIIENLFSNISKYALESSRVYIDIKNNGLKVKISLKNISKEKLNISSEELMQRFVRGDKSRTTEGSGLGLSISQSLTELQKGIFSLNVDGDLFKVELEFDIAK